MRATMVWSREGTVMAVTSPPNRTLSTGCGACWPITRSRWGACGPDARRTGVHRADDLPGASRSLIMWPSRSATRQRAGELGEISAPCLAAW